MSLVELYEQTVSQFDEVLQRETKNEHVFNALLRLDPLRLRLKLWGGDVKFPDKSTPLSSSLDKSVRDTLSRILNFVQEIHSVLATCDKYSENSFPNNAIDNNIGNTTEDLDLLIAHTRAINTSVEAQLQIGATSALHRLLQNCEYALDDELSDSERSFYSFEDEEEEVADVDNVFDAYRVPSGKFDDVNLFNEVASSEEGSNDDGERTDSGSKVQPGRVNNFTGATLVNDNGNSGHRYEVSNEGPRDKSLKSTDYKVKKSDRVAQVDFQQNDTDEDRAGIANQSRPMKRIKDKENAKSKKADSPPSSPRGSPPSGRNRPRWSRVSSYSETSAEDDADQASFTRSTYSNNESESIHDESTREDDTTRASTRDETTSVLSTAHDEASADTSSSRGTVRSPPGPSQPQPRMRDDFSIEIIEERSYATESGATRSTGISRSNPDSDIEAGIASLETEDRNDKSRLDTLLRGNVELQESIQEITEFIRDKLDKPRDGTDPLRATANNQNEARLTADTLREEVTRSVAEIRIDVIRNIQGSEQRLQELTRMVTQQHAELTSRISESEKKLMENQKSTGKKEKSNGKKHKPTDHKSRSTTVRYRDEHSPASSNVLISTDMGSSDSRKAQVDSRDPAPSRPTRSGDYRNPFKYEEPPYHSTVDAYGSSLYPRSKRSRPLYRPLLPPPPSYPPASSSIGPTQMPSYSYGSNPFGSHPYAETPTTLVSRNEIFPQTLQHFSIPYRYSVESPDHLVIERAMTQQELAYLANFSRTAGMGAPMPTYAPNIMQPWPMIEAPGPVPQYPWQQSHSYAPANSTDPYAYERSRYRY